MLQTVESTCLELPNASTLRSKNSKKIVIVGWKFAWSEVSHSIPVLTQWQSNAAVSGALQAPKCLLQQGSEALGEPGGLCDIGALF